MARYSTSARANFRCFKRTAASRRSSLSFGSGGTFPPSACSPPEIEAEASHGTSNREIGVGALLRQHFQGARKQRCGNRGFLAGTRRSARKRLAAVHRDYL